MKVIIVILLASAEADLDYASTSVALIVPDNSTDEDMNQCINITITDDSILENAEIFAIVLETSEPHVMLGNNISFISIVDNDGKYSFHKNYIHSQFLFVLYF